MHRYLGFSGAQDVNHHLHDGLVHPQWPHQVRVLVEHFIFHDITIEERILVPNTWTDPEVVANSDCHSFPLAFFASCLWPYHVIGLFPDCVHLFRVSPWLVYVSLFKSTAYWFFCCLFVFYGQFISLLITCYTNLNTHEYHHTCRCTFAI